MLKILVPVDGSDNSLHAVRHVSQEFMKNPALEIHLLNVQAPFSQYISRFVSRGDRHHFHCDQAKRALLPSRRMLDRLGARYQVHMELGEKASVIADLARRLHCDHIVMSTARKSSLTRLLQSSTTNRVIAATSVPVEIIAGDVASRLERYGVPAGAGAVLALLFLAAAE